VCLDYVLDLVDLIVAEDDQKMILEVVIMKVFDCALGLGRIFHRHKAASGGLVIEVYNSSGRNNISVLRKEFKDIVVVNRSRQVSDKDAANHSAPR
jgi:hypothetical protein